MVERAFARQWAPRVPQISTWVRESADYRLPRGDARHPVIFAPETPKEDLHGKQG